MNRMAGVLCLVLACLLATARSQTIENPPSATSPGTKANPPVIDGGAGPCSLELTVLAADDKPVYKATVKVHITYGFGGFHHLDLQAGTNSDGKVKFTGVPVKVHNPPLEFDATKDQLEGTVTYDPSTECQAKHDVKLQKPKPPEQP
jgi:hypothetical protein